MRALFLKALELRDRVKAAGKEAELSAAPQGEIGTPFKKRERKG